jgi:hypothetical protein
MVRWLRPEYQIPRFGSDAEKARLREQRIEAQKVLVASEPEEIAILQTGSGAYPRGDAERKSSAANSAIVTKAKLSGLWVDRSEVGEVDLTRMSREELKDYLCERYGEERGNELIAWLEKIGVLNDQPSPESQTTYSRSSLKNRLPKSGHPNSTRNAALRLKPTTTV